MHRFGIRIPSTPAASAAPKPLGWACASLILGGLLLAATACSGTGSAPESPGADPAAAQPAATAADSAIDTAAATAGCTAPASWFPHSQTPRPDDNATFSKNCDFHQWSAQMFLWLTQTMPDGQLRFEHFARPSALLPSGGGTPPPYDQVAGDAATTMPRVAKSDDPTLLNEVNQAGSLGIMVDPHTNRAVYYSMYVNQTFYDFVVDNGLFDPDTFYQASDTLDFPVGSLELKASWKILDGSEGGDEGWYTREMTIAELAEEDGNVVVDPSATEAVQVALVGFHIAGVVNQHPEFIWATFEHQDNAPTLSDAQLAAYLDASDSSINQQPVSDQSFTFYRAGTKFVDSNQNNVGLLELTDASEQTLTPVTDGFIQYAQGGGSEGNRSHVQELNASVHAQLADPVFDTYDYGGAIWLAADDGLVPNSTLQDLITGSTALSNVTMETFTQKVLEQNNCFGCHNTMQRFPQQTGTGVKPLPGKNLNVSHILVNNYFQAAQMQSQSADAGDGGASTPDPIAD